MMPATDPEVTSMEDPPALGDKEGSLTNVLSSALPTTEPSSAPLFPTNTRQNFTSETMIETKAVSMASKDCSSSLSSPAEASPAKPSVTSPITLNGTVETSPATSLIASASDSLTCTGTSRVNGSESSSELPSTTYGCPSPETNFPAVLIFRGISVTLENHNVWKQFHSCGTEMILSKHGRRMFPYCRYRLAGLDPRRVYSMVLSIAPSDNYKYRWGTNKWEVGGPAESQQGLMRAFPHHHSPCRGSEWMSGLVSFYKLKLINNTQDQDCHIRLQSMHRYIPRLHVIPVPDGAKPNINEPLFLGLDSITFTFPQTEFMAVTTYQNFRITQLKINYNPFAKGFREVGNNTRLTRGFREVGNNTRLTRVTTLAQPVTKTDPSLVEPAELGGTEEEVVDPSAKNPTVSASPSNEQEAKLVLKPIMSSTGGKHEPFVPCIRGKHALGELVLVHKHPREEPEEETHTAGETQRVQRDFTVAPGKNSTTPTPSTRSSTGYRKRRRRRRWVIPRGREWKAANASPAVVHSPSLTVAMQPELDDVEGLLFVSFTSKEALEIHIRDKPAHNTSPASPATTQMPLNQKGVAGVSAEVIPESGEEKMARLEALLLQHFRVFKHRQVIHPVLQQVGLRLSSLDTTQSINLQYLGVILPLPPPKLPPRDNATSPRDECLPFTSRTGKTSDMTKIKGWRNKFVRSNETSPSNCDGPQKNLSAFCSNMLDKYLESEGQYISERAAAFSADPEGPVAYQLPAKSSSYVKTLDSVLKQNAASKVPVGANRPCPLSHKPPSYSALTSSAPPPLANRSSPVQAGAQSMQPSAAPHVQSDAAVIGSTATGSESISSVTQRLSTYHPGLSQRAEVSSGPSQGMAHRPTGFNKVQLQLLDMEIGALNEGLSRTQLTPGRLDVALSTMLTKEMLPSQFLKINPYPNSTAEPPECGQDFCRLGCVCSSLRRQHTGSLHCRRPECMFGCDCFKRKITKLLNTGEGGEHIQPIYSLTNMDHAVQSRPGSRAHSLWNCKTDNVDPDPLFTPKSAPLHPSPAKVVKRSCAFRPPTPIREEDKDPVYRYFESKMTCARVREFNSKPPPEVTLEPTIFNTSTQNTSAQAVKSTNDPLPRMYYRTVQSVKSADIDAETHARKQIEIQSECQWKKDRKKVLEALCRRLRQNRLCRRFYIGPYRIRPVAKIFMKKPSGSLVTYRIHISQPPQASDDDESHDSDEEKHANNSLDQDMDAEEEIGQIEDPVTLSGVIPFWNGVLPAGKLKAMTKPVGWQDTHGLIQVNDKSYNHARLLLGNIGSLHPANRLAAYVTGRLRAYANTSLKTSQRPDPTPSILHVKAAGIVDPSTITARKTTELKTPTQPQVSQPDPLRNGCVTLPQQSQRSSAINLVSTYVSAQGTIISPFPSSSTTSNVSLTVSPSLKTPSFLEKSGTYSFRICPPADQGTGGQNPPGVILPGGFTLIQLPKHGADGATQQSGNTTNSSLGWLSAGVAQALKPKDDLSNVGHLAADADAHLRGQDIFTRAKELLSSGSVKPGSSTGLLCTEKVDLNPDPTSEDLSSDSSDYCGEGDEDVMFVDVETVEESQGMAINIMREDARKASGESRDSSDDVGSAQERGVQDQTGSEHNDCKVKMRQTLHTVLERQRRTEQRILFDKLQDLLQSDRKIPRLLLLSKARQEIKHLVDTSNYLQEHKRKLIHIQSCYVKKLSLLTGKPDALIRLKLKEIYDRQKMREKTKKWVPFYSHLLQSRAALLQDTDPEPMPRSTPLLETNFLMVTSQPNACTAAAQSSVDQTSKPSPHSLLLAVPSPAQVGVSDSQAQCTPPVPSDTAAPEAATAHRDSPGFKALTSSNAPLNTQHALTLPLIRAKNGRIILPSTIRPNGRGFYTLMVVNPKENGGKGEVDTQPPEADQKKSLDQSDQPTESSHDLKDNAVTSPNSEPKQSGTMVTVAPLVQRNKSICVPSAAPQGTKNNQENTVVDPPVSTVPTLMPRARGRPRKQPVIPVNKNGIHGRKSAGDSKTSILVAGSEESTLRVTRGRVRDNNPNPVVPVKRGRGRPPSKKQNIPSKSDRDSPVRFSSSFKSPDTTTTSDGHANTSRPLTRGSLGKDFPSEKKRSWIDVEKDLEPELESE